jgi:hypothetical protein
MHAAALTHSAKFLWRESSNVIHVEPEPAVTVCPVFKMWMDVVPNGRMRFVVIGIHPNR